MAYPRLTRKTTVFVDLETTPGTYANPDATATNAVAVSNFSIRFITDRQARDIYKSTLGDFPDVVTSMHVEVSFDVELKGAGVDADNNVVEPVIGKLLQGCGMKKYTLSADVDGDTTDETANIYYMPVSASPGESDFKTLSIAIYHGAGVDSTNAEKAMLYKVKGALGTFTIRGEVGNFPRVSFTFTGVLDADPADATVPTATYESTQPVPFQACNLSFDGQTFFKPTTFEFNIGNTVSIRRAFTEAYGIYGVVISDRAPTGSIDPEAFLESDYALFAKFKAGTPAVLDLGPLGSDNGNIIRIYAPKVQVTDYNFGDRDGILTYDLPLKFCEDSGDDEIRIEFPYDSSHIVT